VDQSQNKVLFGLLKALGTSLKIGVARILCEAKKQRCREEKDHQHKKLN